MTKFQYEYCYLQLTLFVFNILYISQLLCDSSSFTLFDWDSIDIADHLKFDEFRAIDGSNNNLLNPSWGKAFSEVVRCIPSAYGDGYNSLAGIYRQNPREISNVLSSQIPEESSEFVNNRFLTQFAWQWGQFIDHDITLISEDKTDNDYDLDIDIYVPCCDPTFDSECVCDADFTMNVFRTAAFEDSGSNITNPRNQFNDITSYMDASMIYGSDHVRADELRTFSGGLLKTSTSEHGDELLPFNVNHLLNEPNEEDKFYIGGDVRVNEQMGLLTMHTIFVRLHNKIAQLMINGVIDNNPNDDDVQIDDKVYEYTKLIINAMIQKITYSDWLPTMFGSTAVSLYLDDEYTGYDEEVHAGICAIFASSAYRFGHTLLPQKLPMRDSRCKKYTPYFTHDLALSDAFFTPNIVTSTPEFIEAAINGFSCTLANEIDTFITGSVRNFLFQSAVDENDESIFGILDLISINLQRGRDHGLSDYNTVRDEIGLDKLTSFDEISSNAELNENFQVLYDKDINNIDLFMGGLAEDHFDDGSFGELISKIVLEQFNRLRIGDRFFYKNYITDDILREFIEDVTLKDILEFTTNIDEIDTLDENNNIFQNTEAISIFETTSASPKASPPSSLVHNILIYIHDRDLEDFILFIILTINLLISILFICNKFCRKQIDDKAKKYNEVEYSSDDDTDHENDHI